jgi:hypothetical protein
MKKFQVLVVFGIAIGVAIIGSCTKSDTPAPSPCGNSILKVTLSSNPSNVCTPNGTIAVATTGSTGATTFQYQLDNLGFGSQTDFTSVSAGEHSVTVKNNLGCSKTEKITVVAKTSGTQFEAVKTLLNNKCSQCHGNGNARGGFSFDNQCNIITKSARIVTRAVTTGDMPFGGPELTTGEKKIITDWITGGGKDTN